LPAWGAISPEKRRLEASAPVVVRPFAEASWDTTFVGYHPGTAQIKLSLTAAAKLSGF
jgi:hypothetical protein